MNILIDSLFFMAAKHPVAIVFLIFTALLVSSVNTLGALS